MKHQKKRNQLLCKIFAMLIAVTMFSGIASPLTLHTAAADSDERKDGNWGSRISTKETEKPSSTPTAPPGGGINSNSTIVFRDNRNAEVDTLIRHTQYTMSFQVTLSTHELENFMGMNDVKDAQGNPVLDSNGKPLKKINDKLEKKDFNVKQNSDWTLNNDSILTYYAEVEDTENQTTTATFTVSHINFIGTNRAITLQGKNDQSISIYVPESYFESKNTSGSSNTPDDPTVPAELKPVLENIFITTPEGDTLMEVTKDTKPFKLEITFLMYGMEDVDLEDISAQAYTIFLESAGGFNVPKGMRGELTRLVSDSNGTPRYKAEFRDVTFDDKESNEIVLKPVFTIEEKSISTTLNVKIKQAKTKNEDDKDKDKIAPLKPYIIVNQYSYGNEDIVAGSEFALNISYTNTSTNIPLENIVMTITPPEDVSIASSSNTIYIPYLAPKGVLSHEVKLASRPNAKVGSAEVAIKFDYQYVDDVNKERLDGTKEEKIAVPITQIDRFEVQPITELSDFASVGEPFDVTVNFVNKGKTPTFNISAKILSKQKMTYSISPIENLEPGKSDSVVISVTASEPGDFNGEVEIQYEDENNNKKTIKKPFSIFINEGFNEEPFPFPGMNEMDPPPPEKKLGLPSILLCVAGGLFIAAPLAYYQVKKSRAKESEDFDEDF